MAARMVATHSEVLRCCVLIGPFTHQTDDLLSSSDHMQLIFLNQFTYKDKNVWCRRISQTTNKR